MVRAAPPVPVIKEEGEAAEVPDTGHPTPHPHSVTAGLPYGPSVFLWGGRWEHRLSGHFPSFWIYFLEKEPSCSPPRRHLSARSPLCCAPGVCTQEPQKRVLIGTIMRMKKLGLSVVEVSTRQ